MATLALCFICLLSTVNGKGVFYTRPFARDDTKTQGTKNEVEKVKNETLVVKKCVHIIVLKTSCSGSNWLSRHLKTDRPSTKVVFDPIIYHQNNDDIASFPKNNAVGYQGKYQGTNKLGGGSIPTENSHSTLNSVDLLQCGNSQLVSLMSSPLIPLPSTLLSSSSSSSSSSAAAAAASVVFMKSFNKTIQEFNLYQLLPNLKLIKFVRTNIVKTIISYSRKLKIESCIIKGIPIDTCHTQRNFFETQSLALVLYRLVSERIQYDQFINSITTSVSSVNILKNNKLNSAEVTQSPSDEDDHSTGDGDLTIDVNSNRGSTGADVENESKNSNGGDSSGTNTIEQRATLEFKIFRSFVYTIKYEELQKDEKGVMEKLYKWLNIPFAPNNIRFLKLKTTQEDMRAVVENFGEVASFMGERGFALPREVCPLLSMFTTKESKVFEACSWKVLQAKALALLQ